jgi:Skp family chaperone for outer membrane proteins
MKPLASTLLVLFSSGMLAPVAEPTPPRPTSQIVYVSMQRISTESTDAKAATAQLDALRLERTRELTAKQKVLEDTRRQLANAGGVFSASKRAQLTADEERQRTELQRLTQQAQTDFQDLQRQLQATLRQKLTAAIDDLSKRRAIQVVLNQDTAVVWASPGTDVTTEVIERLNASAQPKVGVK